MDVHLLGPGSHRTEAVMASSHDALLLDGLTLVLGDISYGKPASWQWIGDGNLWHLFGLKVSVTLHIILQLAKCFRLQ